MKNIFTPQRLIIIAMIGIAVAFDHFLLAGIGSGIFTAAVLAADRATQSRAGDNYVFPVKSANKIFSGALVVLNAGLAQPGATATGLVAVGVAKRLADNSAGADGAIDVEVEKGIFLFDNSSAGDAITLSDVGSNCYIVDDQTVAKTDGTGTRSIAGQVKYVTSEGVWVQFI